MLVNGYWKDLRVFEVKVIMEFRQLGSKKGWLCLFLLGTVFTISLYLKWFGGLFGRGGQRALELSYEEGSTKEFVEQSTKDPNWEWKRPINFWGVVFDDKGEVLSNCTVRISWNTLSRRGTEWETVLSDSNGRFKLLGKSGKCLSVSVSKNGYRATADSNRNFEFANPGSIDFIKTVEGKPISFHLQRSNPQASVRCFQLRTYIDLPERASLLDPFEVKFGGANAIKFELLEAGGECRIRVSFPAGGLLSSKVDYPVLAPLEGYSNELEEITTHFEDGPCRPILGKFFFRLKNGLVYGFCSYQFDFLGNEAANPHRIAGVTMKYWLNSVGGRELEPISLDIPVGISIQDVANGWIPSEIRTVLPGD
ncbi:MAG: carboxypeptidase-like regulatory domain-containing protein [Verrucomicrobiota bacterium]